MNNTKVRDALGPTLCMYEFVCGVIPFGRKQYPLLAEEAVGVALHNGAYDSDPAVAAAAG